jgi:hypothetical protein
VLERDDSESVILTTLAPRTGSREFAGSRTRARPSRTPWPRRDVSEGLDALGEIGERQHVGFYGDEAEGGGRAQGKPLAGGTLARLTRSRG